MTFNIVESFLIILFIALVVTLVFRHLNLPIILGYVLVGALVGPNVLAWLPTTKLIQQLAEFGVVLLMFTIGIEFSLPRLLSLRRTALALGGSEILISIVMTTIIGILVGMTLPSAIVAGAVVAMSSTAIVLKQLSDQLELNSHHGNNAIGILLFQDMAVIPILVLISSLKSTDVHIFWVTLFWSLFKGIIAIVIILGLGRWLLRPIFRTIAATRVLELFTLSVLFVAVGAAWLTNFFGLSYALGSFLAGIMLAECEYRHQIKIEIRPFRDILLGLFFISIGMLVNISAWGHTWGWIILLVVGLMIAKPLLIIALCKFEKNNLLTAVKTGLVLAQGSEFGFAILSVALSQELLPYDWGQSILGALLISFIISPIIIRYNGKIVRRFFPKLEATHARKIKTSISKQSKSLKKHIIICGYGRIGQNIARFLEKIKYPYLGIDLDPQIVSSATLAGDSVIYGDGAHPEILKAAQINHATAIILTFDYVQTAISAINHIKMINPNIPILSRSRDDAERILLEQQGATFIVTEVFEESLTMVHQLFKMIHLPSQTINKILQDTRDKNYETLLKIFPGSISENITENALHEYVRPILLTENALAAGKTLRELELNKGGVEVIAIRHKKLRHLKPKGGTKLYVGDILIVYGSPEQLERAERILLGG